MRLHPALLLLFAMWPLGLSAGTVNVTVYAVEARAADRFPPEIVDSGAKLAAHLQELREEGKAAVPLEFASELPWSTKVEAADGREVEVPLSFTAENKTLKPEQTEARTLGYTTTMRADRGSEGEAHLHLIFEWTPTFAKVPVAEGGEAGWMPTFHTLKAEMQLTAAHDERIVAAMWRASFPLSEADRGADRQLFLVVHWSDPSAE